MHSDVVLCVCVSVWFCLGGWGGFSLLLCLLTSLLTTEPSAINYTSGHLLPRPCLKLAVCPRGRSHVAVLLPQIRCFQCRRCGGRTQTPERRHCSASVPKHLFFRERRLLSEINIVQLLERCSAHCPSCDAEQPISVLSPVNTWRTKTTQSFPSVPRIILMSDDVTTSR